MNHSAPFWVRHAALVFATKTFAAAMLALSIALWLDMPRPYWAMASVFIASNQLTGATWSKAVYRMLGTLIGAAAVIALIYTSVQLALNSSYSADFVSFANSSVALMLGVGLTGVISGIVRLFGAGWIAERLLHSNWKTLAAVADGKTPHDRVAIASLMQHRLALLAARITVVPGEARSNAANLRQLRAALSLVDLRQASLGLSRRTRAVIDAFVTHLASVYRTHAVGRLPHALVGRLDGTIASTLQEPASEARNEALFSLAGIRTGLFPEAPTYQPLQLEPEEMAA